MGTTVNIVTTAMVELVDRALVRRALNALLWLWAGSNQCWAGTVPSGPARFIFLIIQTLHGDRLLQSGQL
jgi:hypothetical protein